MTPATPADERSLGPDRTTRVEVVTPQRSPKAHHVIMQAHDGPQLQSLLERLTTLGITRVTFPAHEYLSIRPADGDDEPPVYETARLLPRGDDDGFAEQFLERQRKGRDT